MSKKNIYEEDYKVINNMRCLSLDMINHAKSGHPGICLGASTILYTLYSRFMNIDINNPNWYNRDRFILSAGHGAPMFYSMLYMLHLISLDDVKNFRKLGGVLKGHPELSIPFVDAATGPLGQGIGMSVGMAIAERYLNKTIHKTLINRYTYVLCGDGDLEEGISYEALALASKLKLNKLIILYDSNNVTLDSDLERTSNEDVITRFKALNFNILVVDGDSIKDIEQAINKCFSSDMPSIIICKTTIGKYSKVEGSNISHGKPLDMEDILNIKKKLGIPSEEFYLDNDSSNYFIRIIQNRMYMKLRGFNRSYNNLKQVDKDRVDMVFNNEITYNFRKSSYHEDNASLRDISGKILNDIANEFSLLIGGSADLSSSCKTNLSDLGIFDSNNYCGRNIYFGIREHAMGAIMNGIALSNLRVFGSTFLVFSDYLRGAIRMSAIMNLPVIYIFTHDSLTVGEDGITHEPVEQLASLELIPNLYVYRPCDSNELVACYKDILNNRHPSVLVLPRDNKEYTELSKKVDIKMGAYILKEEKKKKFVTLLANGEEVHLALKVSEILNKNKIDTRIISMPCKKNYLKNNKHIFPKNNVYAITYGVKDYFYGFTRKVFGMNKFGDTGSKSDLLKHFKFTEIDISNKIINEVGDYHE